MERKASYIKYQMIQNVRIHLTKTKMYVHQSRDFDTVPIMFILWNRIGGIKWSQ